MNFLTAAASLSTSHLSSIAEAGKNVPLVLPVATNNTKTIGASFADTVLSDGSLSSPKLSPSIFDRRSDLVREKAESFGIPHDYSVPQLVITTGNADDLVEITKGADNRIHVMVNGKEAWSGTPREFARVRVETGMGNDTVINRVDGAVINTGGGDDTVHNYSWYTEIVTRSGGMFPLPDRDTIVSHGSRNHIVSGDGDDKITSTGDHNVIEAGAGNDNVNSTGHHNTLDAGYGKNGVTSNGNYNTISDSGESLLSGLNGNPKYVHVKGDYNTISVGLGATDIKTQGQGNEVRTSKTGWAELARMLVAEQHRGTAEEYQRRLESKKGFIFGW